MARGLVRWSSSCIGGIVAFLFGPGCALAEVEEGQIGTIELSILRPVVEMCKGSPWLQGGVVIAVTLMVASLVSWILFKILKKITSHTRLELDDQVVHYLRPPVTYTFLVGGITYGLSLMPLGPGVQSIATNTIKSLGIVIWVLFLGKFVSLILNRVAVFSDKFTFIQRRSVTLFDNAAKVVIFAVGIYLIFVIWNIDVTAWLASAGIVGIAVGFAAKDTLSNLFSGVFILADAPYKVGDFIVMDTGGRGKVTHIGLRSTRILTRDDIEVTIPNSVIGNSTIVNQSGGPSEKMRVRLNIGVAYGSDIDQVRKTIMEIAEGDSLVCDVPSPTLRFRVFGASSLDFELRCWVYHPRLCSVVIDSLNTKIYKEFDRLGIEIPYTKQDLYIKGLPDSFGAVQPPRNTQPELSGQE